MGRLHHARRPTARDDADLVEFAGTAQVYLRRNVATAAGSFHDANDPTIVAKAGCVIASPSYPAADPDVTNQNYVFHWVRDAAVAAIELAAAPTLDANGVDRTLCDYVAFSQVCQEKAEATGEFFLARFRIDGDPLTLWDTHAYTSSWSEQKDGPALQSSSIIAAWPHLDADARNTARQVAQLDLDRTVGSWDDDAHKFGPWEDVSGPSFFAHAAQVRFLEEVTTTNTLGLTPTAGLDRALDGLRAELDSHWSDVDGWYRSIPGGAPDRPGYDPNADVIMACIYGAIRCTDPKLLATAAALRAAFSDDGADPYRINKEDLGRGLGPMIGRYPGDTYDGDTADQDDEGHPWAICTANFAQLYYLLAREFLAGTGLTADDLTDPFYAQLGLTAGTVNEPTRADAVAHALVAAGDTMLRALIYHSADRHLSEQFDRNTGFEKSVEDLTWSYAAYLSAVRARP